MLSVKLPAAVVLLCVCPAVGRCDIVSWTDDQGVRHYTNVREDIPEIYRDTVKTVVKDAAGRSEAQPAEPVDAEAGKRDRRRMAQVVHGRTAVSRDYVRGFLEGVAFGRQAERRDVEIDISGPLAVAAATGGPLPGLYYGQIAGAYPFITTAFDRGRSRHLTLRLLLQEQFQMDRAAPYVYEARFLGAGPGLGLKPFHPRVLPRRFPGDLRVIRR